MVDSSWVLAVNQEENLLDTQWPAGDKPGTPIDILPDPVKDLVATATGTSTIQLTWSSVIGATAYIIQGSADNVNFEDMASVTSSPYNAINLQSSTQYWARIYTENENGRGPASNTATATTDTAETPEPGEAIFYEDFARYSSGTRLNNVNWPVGNARWTSSAKDAPNVVEVQNNQLVFEYRQAPWCEQQFHFDTPLSDLTIEFRMLTPQTLQTGGDLDVSNSKMLQIWGGNRGDYNLSMNKVGASLWENYETNTVMKHWGQTGGMGPGPSTPSYNFIHAGNLNTWITVKYQIKAPTPSSNGTIKLFRDGTLCCSGSADNWDTGGDPNYYSEGYFMGWANGNYSNIRTVFKIDWIRVYSGIV